MKSTESRQIEEDRTIVAFLPCRKGSQRVVNKNTRPFGPYRFGLAQAKLNQLKACEGIDRVVVSTDDPIVHDLVEDSRPGFGKELDVFWRPEHLAVSDSLDAFVKYIPEIVTSGILLWTHATSPFFGPKNLDLAIQAYKREVESGVFDSLMSVRTIQSFMYDQNGDCVSHDRGQVKWPRTQDLPKFYEVNSAVFMIRIELMTQMADRVGDKPYLFETSEIAGFDIDWPEEFTLAEALLATGHANEA